MEATISDIVVKMPLWIWLLVLNVGLTGFVIEGFVRKMQDIKRKSVRSVEAACVLMSTYIPRKVRRKKRLCR